MAAGNFFHEAAELAGSPANYLKSNFNARLFGQIIALRHGAGPGRLNLTAARAETGPWLRRLLIFLTFVLIVKGNSDKPPGGPDKLVIHKVKNMQMQFKTGKVEKTAADAAIFLFEGKNDLNDRPDLEAVREVIVPLLKDGQFKPSLLAELPVKVEKGWLLLIGLGAADQVDPARIIEASALAVKMALARNLRKLEMALPPVPALKPESVLELAAVGAGLGLYKQTEFKSDPGPKASLEKIRFLGEALKDGPAIVERARIMAEAVDLCRRLGDQPGNVLYPDSFAREAAALAKPLKLKVDILDEKALAKEKMNFILAVGSGSARPPRLVTIKYQGAGAKQKPVVLVGKGITFDSGGMSLKPAGSLEAMKTDMAGAAAVLAVVVAAAILKLPVNVTAVMPLAENMPDGGGVRVGDVIAGRSGKTVEITNTDAEGRLILADALTLAGEMKPAAIIDVATLTGACAVALGDNCAGLFTDDLALREGLLASAGCMGENIWPLPLLKEYECNLKSETADLINAPTVPRGGAINAALFLRKFVPAEIPWAHLDIAGPGRTAKGRPGFPAGASGFAVRTLLRFLAFSAGRK